MFKALLTTVGSGTLGVIMASSEGKFEVGDLVRFRRDFYQMTLSQRQSAPGPANMSDMEYWYGTETDKWVGVILQTGIRMGGWGGDSREEIPDGVKIHWNDLKGSNVVFVSYETEVEKVLDKAESK